MAEEEEAASKDSNTLPETPQPPPYLEVLCKISGKNRRFAVGTEAGFAVSLINRKLDIGAPIGLHIEAVKEGEEPISFGPSSILVNYGHGWKLQIVTEVDYAGARKGEGLRPMAMPFPTVMSSDGSRPTKRELKPVDSFVYFGKIFVAFILLFVLGGIFTLALENLPRLILFINSWM